MPQDECPVCKIGRIPATFFLWKARKLIMFLNNFRFMFDCRGSSKCIYEPKCRKQKANCNMMLFEPRFKSIRFAATFD